MYNIKRTVPHLGPHFDEALAETLAIRYGGLNISFVDNVPVVPEQLECTEAEALARGDLPLGQLKGIFDDKYPDGKRMPRTSCAFRMAGYLGISKRPELQKLFRAVNRVDGTATASRSDLSSMMKDAINSFPQSAHPVIFRWATRACHAIIKYLTIVDEIETRTQKLVCNDFVRPTAVLEAMISDGVTNNPGIIDRMRHLVTSSEKQLENCIEISFVMRAMKVTGISDDDAMEWLYMGLSKCIQQQEDRLRAIEEIKRNGKPFQIKSRWNGDKLTGLLIRSDNLQIANASRDRQFQYAVCIVRRSGRNVAIMPNGFDRLDMRAAWALIRLEETPIDLRKAALFESYMVTGNHPAAPHWHMMENGAALNGSNHITAVPTTLSDETLVGIVRNGFITRAQEIFNEIVREAGGNPVSTMVWPDRQNPESNRQKSTTNHMIDVPVAVKAQELHELGCVFDGVGGS